MVGEAGKATYYCRRFCKLEKRDGGSDEDEVINEQINNEAEVAVALCNLVAIHILTLLFQFLSLLCSH